MHRLYLYLGIIAPDILQFAIYQHHTLLTMAILMLVKAAYTLLSLHIASRSFLYQQLFAFCNFVPDFWLYLMGIIAILIHSTTQAWKARHPSADTGSPNKQSVSDCERVGVDSILDKSIFHEKELSILLGAKYIPAFIELSWLAMGLCASMHIAWPYNAYTLVIFFIQGFRYKSRFIKNELCWTPRNLN